MTTTIHTASPSPRRKNQNAPPTAPPTKRTCRSVTMPYTMTPTGQESPVSSHGETTLQRLSASFLTTVSVHSIQTHPFPIPFQYPTCHSFAFPAAELLSHTPHALKRKIDYDHEDVFDDSVSTYASLHFVLCLSTVLTIPSHSTFLRRLPLPNVPAPHRLNLRRHPQLLPRPTLRMCPRLGPNVA